MATSNPSNPSKSTSPLFTPLEQEILDEYTLLLDNLNNVSYGPFPFSFSLALPLPHSKEITYQISYKQQQQQLSQELSTLSERPAGEILDGLRMLERKMSLVFTLLKASVYSIVLQQGIGDDDGEGRGKG